MNYITLEHVTIFPSSGTERISFSSLHLASSIKMAKELINCKLEKKKQHTSVNTVDTCRGFSPKPCYQFLLNFYVTLSTKCRVDKS